MTSKGATAQPLSASEWGFGPLFDAIKDAVIVADAQTGRILLWNDAAEELFQYTQDEALTLRLEDLVPPQFKDAHRKGLESFAKTRTGTLIDSGMLVEVPAVRRDGVELLIQLTLSRIIHPLDPDGAYAMGLLRDVTALRLSEQTVQLMLDAAAQSIFALDRLGRCIMANRAAGMVLGRSPDDLRDQNMHELMHHSYPDGSPFPVEKCRIFDTVRIGVPTQNGTEVFWRADGSSFPPEYRSEPIVRNGMLLGAVVTFTDITDRKRAEAEALKRQLELEHKVHTDVLTGLGNRRHANQLVEWLSVGDALVMIDIDGFKAVNDTLGHNAGDELLVALAHHLKGHLRDGDSIARFGGEEFLVALRGVATEAVEVVTRMAQAWASSGRTTTFSAGICMHSAHSSGAQTLAAADSAMYEAKRAGRNRIVLAGNTIATVRPKGFEPLTS